MRFYLNVHFQGERVNFSATLVIPTKYRTIGFVTTKQQEIKNSNGGPKSSYVRWLMNSLEFNFEYQVYNTPKLTYSMHVRHITCITPYQTDVQFNVGKSHSLHRVPHMRALKCRSLTHSPVKR